MELKNGETYNGHLVSCDTWMNVHLKEVICTSKDGDRFWRMANCYVRGNTIKYICVPDEVLPLVEEENLRMASRPQSGGRGGGRGGRYGGRGDGGHGGGRGDAADATWTRWTRRPRRSRVIARRNNPT